MAHEVQTTLARHVNVRENPFIVFMPKAGPRLVCIARQGTGVIMPFQNLSEEPPDRRLIVNDQYFFHHLSAACKQSVIKFS